MTEITNTLMFLKTTHLKGEMMSGRDELWRAIEILVELGEKELAFDLRVVYNTNYRPEWK